MIQKIKEHIADVETFSPKSLEELEQFRIKYLGKKGLLNDFLLSLKMFPTTKKKSLGRLLIF